MSHNSKCTHARLRTHRQIQAHSGTHTHTHTHTHIHAHIYKHVFVATKMILVAAPANDSLRRVVVRSVVGGGGWCVGGTESESAWKGRSPRTDKQWSERPKRRAQRRVVFGLSVSRTLRPESALDPLLGTHTAGSRTRGTSPVPRSVRKVHCPSASLPVVPAFCT